MHKISINKALSRNVNIFDEIINDMEYEFNKPAYTIQEMKDRDDMKRKGDIWELFCRDWLQALPNYDKVLFLEEFNQENPNVFISKQDNGIDLIAITKKGTWHAVQCKYRKTKYLSWTTLSTFIALCERSQCFEKFVVMTNCKGVTHKLPRTEKDKSICYTTLANTKRDHWLRMVGMDNYNTNLHYQPNQDMNKTTISYQNGSTKNMKKSDMQTKKKINQLSLSDLRQVRSRYYDNLSKLSDE